MDDELKKYIDELLWGGVDKDNYAIIENYIKLDFTGYKVSYNIEELTDSFISNVIKDSEIIGDISTIRTGKAGYKQLEQINSIYLNKAIIDNSLDPLHADGQFNPLILDGYRLSSHSFLIEIGKDLIKLIPRNPNNKVLYA